MGPITPVLMSGGAGTRLWPLSRGARPKQFHALSGGRTLIQETALRNLGPTFAPPMVACAPAHLQLVRDQLAEVGVSPSLILLEPAARNTAACAAAAAATLAAHTPDALMLLLPSDHEITDPAAYLEAVARGAEAARDGALVVFGLKPDRPETGYGYISADATVGGCVRPVSAFVEKPDAESAARFVADPAYSWNAGMFLFKAGAFLEEARRLAPEVAAAAEASVAHGRRQGDVLVLGPEFLASPSISIDYAIMEKTDRAAVALCDLGWSDVGAWPTLWEMGARDAQGNLLVGDAVTADARGNLVHTDGPTVVLTGVSDLVVIVNDGVVLVAPRGRPEAVRDAVAALKAAGRDDLV